jgi:hypothetical protein
MSDPFASRLGRKAEARSSKLKKSWIDGMELVINVSRSWRTTVTHTFFATGWLRMIGCWIPFVGAAHLRIFMTIGERNV